MKLPTIWVVIDEFHDYGLRSYQVLAYFFDEDEAENWAQKQKLQTYQIEEVEGPEKC